MDDEKKTRPSAAGNPAHPERPKDANGLAKHYQNFFQRLERGRHRALHAFLAGAVDTYNAYLSDSHSYHLLRTDLSWGPKDKVPEVLSDSRYVLIHLTQAKSRDPRREAGRYARVVDYLIEKRINDCEAHLNEHGYFELYKRAINEFPRKSPKPKSRKSDYVDLSVRVHVSVARRIERVREHCKEPSEFKLRCTINPEGEQVIAGAIEQGIEKEPDTLHSSARKYRNSIRKWRLAMEAEAGLAGGITPYVIDGRRIIRMRE